KKYQAKEANNLISILQDIPQSEGYISVEAVVKISKYLSLPTVKIYSVASFYDQFCFEKGDKVVIKVCGGTSCHLNNSSALIDEIKKQLKVINSDDSMFSLQIVPCMGGCSKGPVFSIGDIYYTSASPAMVKQAIIEYLANHKL
ncbi:MAG TPA: NAD(P)H-dependent oxidoreductase subunit E, partial [Bacteroidales bacterium]|nr:NAD(P)H-dependent oxidoreductase subunit E [Bacteroidales bacterium]